MMLIYHTDDHSLLQTKENKSSSIDLNKIKQTNLIHKCAPPHTLKYILVESNAFSQILNPTHATEKYKCTYLGANSCDVCIQRERERERERERDREKRGGRERKKQP